MIATAYLFVLNWAVGLALWALTIAVYNVERGFVRMAAVAAFSAVPGTLAINPAIIAALRLLFAAAAALYLFCDKPSSVAVGAALFFAVLSVAVDLTSLYIAEKMIGEGRAILVSLILAMALAAVSAAVETLSTFIVSRRKTAVGECAIAILAEGKELATTGFYDSGNTAFERGVPIVVVAKSFIKKSSLKTDGSVFIRTISGLKALPTIPLKIKVYTETGAHKVYEALGAVSDVPLKADVILNSCMTEDL